MKTTKTIILIALLSLGNFAQAKIIQHTDENGNPTFCELDSNGLHFIKGNCADIDTGLLPVNSSLTQVYDPYGNPKLCIGPGHNEKVAPVVIGEVCPIFQSFHDKFVCSTQEGDKIVVHQHHLRLTEIYAYAYGEVFHALDTNLLPNSITNGLSLSNIDAEHLKPKNITFLHLDHLAYTPHLPNYISIDIQNGSTSKIQAIECEQHY